MKYEINFTARCNTKRPGIYLLSCKKCEIKYVGKTTTPICTRLRGHRGNIIAGKEAKVVLDHFTLVHSIDDILMKPIEFVGADKLSTMEKYWIAELGTLFPYGLNTRADF